MVKWPTIVALIVLLTATALDWSWIWGLFFLYWSLLGFAMGETFVIQPVRQDENPVLFRLVSLMWLIMAALTILYDLFPATAALWLGGPNG